MAPGVDFGQAGNLAVLFTYASSEDGICEGATRLGEWLERGAAGPIAAVGRSSRWEDPTVGVVEQRPGALADHWPSGHASSGCTSEGVHVREVYSTLCRSQNRIVTLPGGCKPCAK